MTPNYTRISDALYKSAHRLLYSDENPTPLYADEFCKLSSEVLNFSDLLFETKGETPEEEAEICVALLMGYNATCYGVNREEKVQKVLDRACRVMELVRDEGVRRRLVQSIDFYS